MSTDLFCNLQCPSKNCKHRGKRYRNRYLIGIFHFWGWSREWIYFREQVIKKNYSLCCWYLKFRVFCREKSGHFHQGYLSWWTNVPPLCIRVFKNKDMCTDQIIYMHQTFVHQMFIVMLISCKQEIKCMYMKSNILVSDLMSSRFQDFTS